MILSSLLMLVLNIQGLASQSQVLPKCLSPLEDTEMFFNCLYITLLLLRRYVKM